MREKTGNIHTCFYVIKLNTLEIHMYVIDFCRSPELAKFVNHVKQSALQNSVKHNPCYVPPGNSLIRCLNGGSCISLKNKGQNEQKYTCECSPKFTGINNTYIGLIYA